MRHPSQNSEVLSRVIAVVASYSACARASLRSSRGWAIVVLLCTVLRGISFAVLALKPAPAPSAIITFPGDGLWHLMGPQPVDVPFSVNSYLRK